MRNIAIIILLTVFYTVSSFCQKTATPFTDAQRQTKGSMERSLQSGQEFADYPRLKMSPQSRDIELPSAHDNSGQPYLRPVFSQNGASCGQAASVAYNFCYEINRLRNLPADTSINLYPDHFVWNFMNATLPYYGEGVNYFHTFDILYDAGNPTEDIYGPITMDDQYYWMNGYEGYLQAMSNRISGISSINVATPEGLLILKHWLHNHLDGSDVGGVANYYAGMSNMLPLPEGTPEAGKYVQYEFQPIASHALTIVGYNDSIRLDINNDGQFTNDLDITGDGIVDMKDWEIGGLKFVNSYGPYWGDEGFCYMLYRTLALKYGEGGVWNNSTHILHPDADYHPLLTAKATIQHNKRGCIRLTAGISSDTARYYPEHTLSFSVFNNQGGDFFMSGSQLPSGKTLELGLDITPLLSYIKPGIPARYFLVIDENDPDSSGVGMLLNYSVINYSSSDPAESISADTPLPLVNNGKTIASVVAPTEVEPILIQPGGPVLVTPGIPLTKTFTATGGYPPYTWNLKHIYTESDGVESYATPAGNPVTPTNPATGFAAVPLPFSFPFYGNLYDTLYMHVNGYLMFDHQDMPYYYLLFDEPYLRQIKAIAAFMNKDLALHNEADFMSVEVAPEEVNFNWRISDAEGNNYAIFTISVKPDGNIDFKYGQSEMADGIKPVIGISNGSRQDILLSARSGKKVNEGQTTGFSPSKLPQGISLTEDGELSISPESLLFSDELIITATDKYRLQAEKKLLITTGFEILVRTADSLQVAAPGSTLPLEVEIKNHGTQPVSNLNLSLRKASSNASLVGEPVSGIEILHGNSVVISGVFSLSISDTISSPQIARIKAELTSGAISLQKSAEFAVELPVVVVSPPLVADGDDLTAFPGEEFPLVFNIFNYGNASAGNLSTTLNISDPFAAINGNREIQIGELKSFSKKSAVYTLKVNDAAPFGRQIILKLEVRNEQGILFTGNFQLVLGGNPVMIIDLDKNHNSAVHIASSLSQLNIGSDLIESIDPSVLNYDIAFMSLGFFTQNYTLKPSDDSLMVAFLNQGGKLYLEGGAFFKQDPATALRTRLRVDGSSLAWPAPADSLIGLAGTPAEGIHIEYLGDWKRGENLLPLEPAVPWFRDKNSALDFVVALDSGYYKTIASTIEFGGTFMYDGPGRLELMQRYLNFLGYDTAPLSVVFSPEATQLCKGTSIGFEPLSSGMPLSYQWAFEGGTPATWSGPVPTIKYEIAGSFSVSLTVNDGLNTNTFTLDNLIHVDNCTGLEELSEEKFRLYPNPAADFINIEIASSADVAREVVINDLQGRIVLKYLVADSSTILIPVNQLEPGIYLVNIKGEKWNGSAKLIIH
ncbi:MAG: T9SS type A sorting domain-containing protein [Lentimicrobium sp.]|nr:T9SS type A sorting domain-containing protein [Lentimicrobium sp.]